jgi:hypothetical protein
MAVDAIAFRKPPKIEEGDNTLGTIGKIAGGVGGAFAGGVPGAMAGMQAGGMAGSLLAGESAAPKISGGGGGAPVATGGDSISRRLAQLDDEKAKKLAGLA